MVTDRVPGSLERGGERPFGTTEQGSRGSTEKKGIESAEREIRASSERQAPGTLGEGGLCARQTEGTRVPQCGGTLGSAEREALWCTDKGSVRARR